MIASLRRTAFTVCLTIALCAAAAAAPVAAQANSGTCDNSQASQPFANWGDNSSYVLAPGGDFEGSPGWTLSGNAAVVAGSEPFAATGTLGSYSLSLPRGSSAESSATCVDANDPTLRFFIGGSGKLMVEVVYSGVGIPVGIVNAGGDWAPSAILPTGSALFDNLWGASDQVYLKFIALTGNPQVDDVFIDPWNRH
jgi:hypothetical protein